MNVVIITGASSGIGREFALALDKGLYNIDVFWLIARRQDRLEELAECLEHPVRIFPMDLSLEKDLDQFASILQQEKPVVRMLINSAGYGLMGAFDSINAVDQCGQIDINCKSLTHMTHICIPYMRKNSRIIQLASSAAFVPQADFAVYAATKSYVLSFSMALRQELKSRNIWVTAVCPGPVRTEFFETAEQYGTTLAVKKLAMVEADRVVKDALRASAARQAISVTGLPIRTLQVMAKILPHELMLSAMGLLKALQKGNTSNET